MNSLGDALRKQGFKNNEKKYKHKNNKNINKGKKDTNRKEEVNIQNPSFYFYKDKAYGKSIENFQLKNTYKNLFLIDRANSFELTTIYPGLLVGSGYNHPKLKEDNEDYQLGFFFDHTTGLPVISGSSIKGVLKSVIKNKEFVEDVYGVEIPISIFDDGKTIFYDAFIANTNDKNNKIFGSDYITPHKNHKKLTDKQGNLIPDELCDPNPIKFLKILPDVTFKFQFRCDEKYLNIFKQIIIDFGLGAKTNVGYGKFRD